MKTLLFFLNTVIIIIDAADIGDLLPGSQKFTEALYKDVPSWNKDTDILLSPFSIQTVLALTQSGAKGQTADEIRSSLFLPEMPQEVMKKALSQIQSKISNKIYVENGFSTNEGFKRHANETYGTTFENIEFINTAAASKTVNDWASEKTNNRFGTSFSSSNDFNKLSKDLLVNTVSFKKNWTSPFEGSRTKVEVFYGANNDRYNVNMMTQGPSLYNYHESAELDAKFLEMGLSQDVSLTIVLPNGVDGMPKIEKKIDLALATPEFVQEFIQLSLPRTNIQATRLDLRGSLERLGVKNLWHNDGADLSGMSGVPGEVAAYNLIHDTYLNIDESGLEGAAGGLVNVRVPPTKHFNINRSFFFYVKVNGIIVFVGKVTAPVYTVHH